MRIRSIDFSQEISSQFSFLIIIILGTVVAWYTISVGNRIVDDAKGGVIFNAEREANEALRKELENKPVRK